MMSSVNMMLIMKSIASFPGTAHFLIFGCIDNTTWKQKSGNTIWEHLSQKQRGKMYRHVCKLIIASHSVSCTKILF